MSTLIFTTLSSSLSSFSSSGGGARTGGGGTASGGPRGMVAMAVQSFTMTSFRADVGLRAGVHGLSMATTMLPVSAVGVATGLVWLWNAADHGTGLGALLSANVISSISL
uniref:(northern house mosquito) hypothetical protein n=1 Tax=Culex pipiens TaxID=7175 RepID=A0A8D8KSR1_CULPI